VLESYGAEPDLLDPAMLAKKFLEVFPSGVKGYIPNKHSALTSFSQLEGGELGFFLFYLRTIIMGSIICKYYYLW
jgi:hypothetical protein